LSTKLNGAILIVIWICDQVFKGHGSIRLITDIRWKYWDRSTGWD
jgi:hypothetical protein